MAPKRVGDDFPMVCVGGSAGGLEAYERFLDALPSDLGVAVVIVNHLRSVDTLLHKLLRAHTAMPVQLIVDHQRVMPNTVYVIPRKRDLHVLHGEFLLEPISKPWGWPDVITVFLGSVTEQWNGKVIAFIVSGYGSDGAMALRGVQDAGGTTIVQLPGTAARPDMPRNAVATGCADLVLTPEDAAVEIARMTRAARG